MSRLLTLVLAAYGLKLSRTGTENIRRLHREAEAGSSEARRHFTQTRYARVLGPPNSDLGQVYYVLVGLCALTGILRHRPVLTAVFVTSGSSVLMSLFLIWALLFRLRVTCKICFQAHAVNGALFALLMRMWLDHDDRTSGGRR